MGGLHATGNQPKWASLMPGSSRHVDLAFSSIVDEIPDDHGTHVAGIIGAIHDNELGVDGVNPFARMRGQVSKTASQGVTEVLTQINTNRDQPVINVSLGYNWYLYSPPN